MKPKNPPRHECADPYCVQKKRSRDDAMAARELRKLQKEASRLTLQEARDLYVVAVSNWNDALDRLAASEKEVSRLSRTLVGAKKQ